jgi:hypothetical protein
MPPAGAWRSVMGAPPSSGDAKRNASSLADDARHERVASGQVVARAARLAGHAADRHASFTASAARALSSVATTSSSTVGSTPNTAAADSSAG